MSSLQDMSNFLFISMTGPKMAQHIQVVSMLLHEAKPALGYSAFIWTQLLEVIIWQLQYAETICWGSGVYGWGLGSGLLAYGQGLVVQCLALGFSLQFN